MPEEPVYQSDANWELAPGVRAPAAALRLQYSRSAGPGGQNVNKVSTKAELWVKISAIQGMNDTALARLQALAGRRLTREREVHLVSQSERSQEGNRHRIFENLRELILLAMIEPKRRKKIRISRAAKARRLDSKRHRGQIKAGRKFSSDD